MQGFVASGELDIKEERLLEYMIDSILMSWQFYTYFMQRLGKTLSIKSAEEAVEYTTNAMLPYMT